MLNFTHGYFISKIFKSKFARLQTSYIHKLTQIVCIKICVLAFVF